jgi:hypothetical protein
MGTMMLMAMMIGQTTVDSPRVGPVLSEWAKKAQARALAEFRANEHTIKPRLAAYYQLENERLMNRIETLNIAASRVWSLTTGTAGHAAYQYQEPWTQRGFASVPPTQNLTASDPQSQLVLEELKRANFLIKGHWRDSRGLYRQANQFYRLEYPIRFELATHGVRP